MRPALDVLLAPATALGAFDSRLRLRGRRDADGPRRSRSVHEQQV